MAVPVADVNFDDINGLQAIVDTWTGQYAATSDIHDANAFAKLPASAQVSARGIEVGHIFYFGHQIFRADEGRGRHRAGGETPVHMGSYGIGRAGWWPPSSRPRTTRPAYLAGPVAQLQGVRSSISSRATPPPMAQARSFTERPEGPKASTRCTTTATSGLATSSPPPTLSACPGRC